MNNLQFIATYIHKNPGAKYTEIIQNLMLWKGRCAEEIVNIGGTYVRYFAKHPPNGPAYQGKLWVKIDKRNRKSGYKLTSKGMTYIVENTWERR